MELFEIVTEFLEFIISYDTEMCGVSASYAKLLLSRLDSYAILIVNGDVSVRLFARDMFALHEAIGAYNTGGLYVSYGFEPTDGFTKHSDVLRQKYADYLAQKAQERADREEQERLSRERKEREEEARRAHKAELRQDILKYIAACEACGEKIKKCAIISEKYSKYEVYEMWHEIERESVQNG
ncbi:MAG: hypothetical protein HDQ88_05840 [Clostridia bacterium]|nr:hypothetical protein [Clostridia bacterium]